MLIPTMRYRVSSFMPYFSASPPPSKEVVRRSGSPFPVEGEGMSFVSIAIPIPEARRPVNRIYQFPGNAH
jgi:hypothetical protein